MFVVVFDFHQEVDKMEDLGRGQKKYLILRSYFVRSSSCVVQHKFISSQTNVNVAYFLIGSHTSHINIRLYQSSYTSYPLNYISPVRSHSPRHFGSSRV